MQAARDFYGFTRFLAIGVIAMGIASGCMPPGPAALLKGERLLRENKTAEAVIAFEEAVRIMPGTAQAWNHLGLAHHREGDVAKAAHAYQRALDLDRNLAVARFNLGSLFLESGNNAAAVDAFTTFCTLQPSVGEGWLRLGQAQVRLAAATPGPTDRQRLAEVARRNLEHAPDSADKANAMGQVLALRGKYRDASEEFSRALTIQPDLASAVMNHAVVLQQLGDRRGALQRYRDYLKMAPGSPQSAGVEALAATLDRELNPVPLVVAVATNPPAPTVVRTASPPATVAVQARPPAVVPKPPVATNPPAAVVKPAPASNVVALVPAKSVVETNIAPVVSVAPLTTVTLEEEAPIKPAVDGPRRSTSAEIVSKPTVLPDEPNLSGLTNPAAKTTPAAEDRSKNSGFLKKLNPTTWFSGKDKAPKQSASAKLPPPTITAPSATNAPAPAPVYVPPPKPTYPRYAYPVRTAPNAGNRDEAEKVFASAVVEHRAGREVTAAAGYRQALLLDPSYFEAYYNLSLALAGTPSGAEALKNAETAVVLYPQSSAARQHFALLLDRAGHATDAAAELEKIVAAEPANANAHLSLANILAQRLAEPAKARVHYLKVLALDPKNSQANAIRFWLATPPM